MQRFVGEQGVPLSRHSRPSACSPSAPGRRADAARGDHGKPHRRFSEQVAVSLASQLLEQARDWRSRRAARRDQLVVAPASTLSPANPLTDAGRPRPLRATWRIRNDQPLANVKEISVRVGWIETGKRRELTITTLRTR